MPFRMNKGEIIRQIVAALAGELEIYSRAAHASRSEATHEQNKAENKYDTRGLEASYLARGQSKQALELIAAIAAFEKIQPRDFSPDDPIDVGALVELELKKERSFYFVGPKAGGTEFTSNGREILVITPQSPLGEQLMGKKQGERVQLSIAGNRDLYRLVAVK
jgi:transcription elongation GreA/GreB family factor